MDSEVKVIRQTDTERVAEIDKDESNQTDGHRESGRDGQFSERNQTDGHRESGRDGQRRK